MMKRYIAGALLFALLLPLFGAGKGSVGFRQVISCDSKYDMQPTFPRTQSRFLTHVKGGGVKGSCYLLICPPPLKTIHINSGKYPSIPIEDSSLILHCSVYLKGKAQGRFGFFCFDEKKKIFYPNPSPGRRFKINSDKWQKFTFTYVPEAGTLYSRKIRFVQPYVSIQTGGRLYIDELVQEIESSNKEIMISQ